MDGELILIFGFVITLVVLGFAMGSSFHKRHIAQVERKERFDRDSRGAGSSKKIEQLEERVRVLERLATDRGQDLASQIEDLRSLPDVNLSANTAEKV